MSLRPNLTGVPETMLWTLHNRASEARRPDGVIRDPDCLRIFEALDYDFEASFGRAGASHAVRSAMFDAEVRAFVAEHARSPSGTPPPVVVNLGEGLETQRYRLADLDVTWVSVDVGEAIAVRERFIRPDDRHRHVACSVLDRRWMDEVPPGPTHITAQGLFMYLPPDTLPPLVRDLAARFPGGWLSFDTIPGWLSRRTTRPGGWRLTPSYTTPPMPFGVSRPELPAWVRTVLPDATVRELPWRFPRGPERYAFAALRSLPVVGRHVPSAWTVTMPSSASRDIRR